MVENIKLFCSWLWLLA
ncbi:hypothetical protein ACQ0P2_03920, partial [Streptococcus canis]